MADAFSPEAFLGSAAQFALSSLEAHHAGNHRRVPLDAGTALEHLAKACLAQRSPALLAELKGESGFNSLIGLLRLEGIGIPAKVRTIGLAEALARSRHFVKSKASKGDLDILIEMRNGIVHTAEDVEVEERILTAFVLQTDALLDDLDRERAQFWGGQLAVVDALLQDASNKVQHRVEVKLAAAEAELMRRYATEGEAVIDFIRSVSKSAPLSANQRFQVCPVCDCYGVATGDHTVDWEVSDWDKETGNVTHVEGEVWFSAQAFRCRTCGLKLGSELKIDAAGIETAWHIENADWRDYEPDYDEDAAYERWREERFE